MTVLPPWLTLTRGSQPLLIAIPHSGDEIPAAIEAGLLSPWLARKDADWWVDRLYDMAVGLGASVLRTAISRCVIDVNRDPSGASLYPGQATTGLCPTTSFDGEPLYRAEAEPDAAKIAARRSAYFDPYHSALANEIARLRHEHGRVVLYDAHSIRSRVPRLFEGELPQFNIGSNRGTSCAAALTGAVEPVCQASPYSTVADGRFVGGWTTRHYGEPAKGVHAIQMELAIRGYLDEPAECRPDNWPPPYDPARAAGLRAVLTDILQSCIAFTRLA